MQQDITFRHWLMILLLGLTWGATFMVIKIALTGLSPFWLAAGRIGFASLLMTLIWGISGWRFWKTDARDWRSLLLIGALSSAVPFMFLSWGQQYVASGFAGVSMAAVALMVLPLAHFFVPGERLTWVKSIGLLIGFAGVLTLLGPQVFESSGQSLETLGRLACFATTFCYALSSVLMRRLPPVDSIGLATVLLLIGSVIVIPAAFIAEGAPVFPSTTTSLIAVIVLGLLPTAAANMLRVMVIREAGPSFMSLTNYQVPIWSVVLGTLILGEALPSTLYIALGMILLGVFLIQWKTIIPLFKKT
ncbi:MAG: DMT family transporter [Halocynthiibacter sp.]